MSDKSRDIGGLSPEEVGARVTAILSAAEQDAREIIEAARRDSSADRREADSSIEHDGPDTQALAELTRALDSLSSRVSAFEHAIDARLEVLWRAIAPTGEPTEMIAAGRRSAAESAVAPAERLRAVDLALRGFSRAQIAAELRSTLAEPQIEQLLDDVLERA